MDLTKVAIVACSGAIRAGTGAFKNSADDDFELKLKKAVPAVIVGGIAGAVIGLQDLPLDENFEIFEITVSCLTTIGITTVIEDVWKGVWRRFEKTNIYNRFFNL